MFLNDITVIVFLFLFFNNNNNNNNKNSLFLANGQEEKPSFLYDVIETLLPEACYHPMKNPQGGRLLEL